MNGNFIFYLILSLINIILIQSENIIEEENQKTFQTQLQEEKYVKKSNINKTG